jgi:8-oxo-dGTP pyrophosphatase MutT (NUDIX family)
MLDLDPERTVAAPRDAATLVILRDGDDGLEVFAVERNKKSRFLGGAVVFPGGKLDASDGAPEWATRVTALHPRAPLFGDPSGALGIAACREALEEAAILPVSGGTITHDALLALRTALNSDASQLAKTLDARGLRLDLASLVPLSRWVTPVAENRRFDTRFYVARAPDGQPGAHDDWETKASWWARPSVILDRFTKGELELYPPTHRTLALFADFASTTSALAWAETSCLEPICPELVRHADARGEALGLVLPGDPEHSLCDVRVAGASRFVLRGAQWLPEHAPSGASKLKRARA